MQRRTKFILFSIYILFFVVLGALIALLGTPMCLKSECERKAAYIILRMDRDANPCEDFHRFICGKGDRKDSLANRNSTQNGPSKTLFEMMSSKVEDYVNRLQSGMDTITEPIYHETLYYGINTVCAEIQSGYNTDITIEYVTQVLSFSLDGTGMTIRNLFNPKKFNESVTAGIYEYKSRMAGFTARRIFDSDFKPDHNDPTLVAFYIRKPGQNLNLASSVTKDSNPSTWGFAMSSVVKTIIRNVDEKNFPTLQTFQEVAAFMIDLERIREESQGAKIKSMRPMDLKEFDDYSDLDLKGYLREIGGDDTKSLTRLYMDLDSTDYFEKLKNILQKYSRYVKVLYIAIQNLFDFAVFLRLDSDVIDLVGSVTSNQVCFFLMNTKLSAIMSSLIIERLKIKKSGALLLGDIFTSLRYVLGTSMKKSTWMDTSTKTKGTLKLQSMASEISLSDTNFDSIKSPGKRRHYYDGLCLKNSFIENALCLHEFFAKKQFSLTRRPMTGFDTGSEIVYNVEYKRENNKLYVPFTILRLPAYEDEWPSNVNFGGIATEMASVMVDGFDYEGSTFGKYGSEDKWWTNNTYKTFENMYRRCSKFYTYPKSTFPKIHKDFSKATGLRLAYKAYVEYKKKNTNNEELLPGLEMYSPKQVFFLSHAHIYCESPGDDKEKKTRIKDYFKIISSSDEFSDTFGCKRKGRKGTARAIDKCMLL